MKGGGNEGPKANKMLEAPKQESGGKDKKEGMDQSQKQKQGGGMNMQMKPKGAA